MKAIEKWAADEFRSVNGQLEWMLYKSLKDAKRLKGLFYAVSFVYFIPDKVDFNSLITAEELFGALKISLAVM
eukprot:gene19886-23647_t